MNPSVLESTPAKSFNPVLLRGINPPNVDIACSLSKSLPTCSKFNFCAKSVPSPNFSNLILDFCIFMSNSLAFSGSCSPILESVIF